MKCTNWVVMRRDTKRKVPVDVPVSILSWLHEKQGAALPPAQDAVKERCGGQLTVSVDIGYDGGCSCSGGSIEIEYACSRCKGTHYPELPQRADELSDLLCVFIARLSEKDHEALKEVHWGALEAHRKSLEAFRAKK